MSPVNAELTRWTPAALALPPEAEERTLSLPLHVVQGEAVDTARFVKNYWQPLKGPAVGGERPGLSSVGERLHKEIGDEILSIERAVMQAHQIYLFEAGARQGTQTSDRARFLVGELSAVLAYLFDDGVENERDAQLARLEQEHAGDPGSRDALASEVEGYAALADRYRAEVVGLGDFDGALIDEAHTLATALRATPDAQVRQSEKGRQALALRNRLLTLLAERIGRVRAAARFVFRHHPQIVREATSTYERRRRAAARRARPEPINPAS